MKCVPVHHGIPAVLHRDVPWLHRHSENGALISNLAISHARIQDGSFVGGGGIQAYLKKKSSDNVFYYYYKYL